MWPTGSYSFRGSLIILRDLLQSVKISMRGVQAGVKALPQSPPLGGTVTLEMLNYSIRSVSVTLASWFHWLGVASLCFSLCLLTCAICNSLSDIFSIRSGFINKNGVRKRNAKKNGKGFPFWMTNADHCYLVVWRVISSHAGAEHTS